MMNSECHDLSAELLEDESQCEFQQAHAAEIDFIRKKMPPDDELQRLSELFRVFGDPTRIRILSVLDMSEMCVCHVAELLGLSISAVSHQLRVLRAAGLVSYRREGKTVIYALADDHVRTMIENGMDHIRE